MIDPISVLKRIPLFAAIPEVDQQRLVGLLRKETLKRGEILFRRGDEGNALYLILQGRIKISLTRQTDAVTLAILGQGEFFGEMALLDGLPRSANTTAMDDSTLYALKRSDFLSFLVHNEKIVRAVLASLSLRLRRTDDQLAEMCFLNLSVRLVSKLAELAEQQGADQDETGTYHLRISQQELAGILGVSRESINKELKLLRDKGWVSTSRNQIHIHQLALLKKRTI